MRLCLVSETWAPDINGVAHTLGQLADELQRRGITLQLVRPRPASMCRDTRMADELQVRGFHLPRYPDVQFGWPCAGQLHAAWHHQRPDVIYLATEGPLGWSALRTAERLGIPTVSGFHTNFDHYASDYGLGWLRGSVARLLRRFHNRTGATLVPTQRQADLLGRQGIERIVVMGRGIDAQHFTPDKRDRLLRQRWGVGDHQPVALHVGRLASEKNLGLLVESFQAMHLAQPDLVSVVVGDGPQRQSLQQRLPTTHFTGFIDSDQLARHYASADLFIFPSRSETYGNVVLEAMASGLAVVAFDYAAAAEWIVPDQHGRIVPLDSPHSFVDQAAQLARAPASYSQLGRAARSRVADCHWSQIADRFLQVLTTAMEHADDRTTHPARL
ncbi:glycosyltransferase family 1 protein [Halomonas sp. ML-15]|uniref:glycosyltransferase family 4 protein n=1 Tax=Halomonas sp. ML-15 TaxID=2773305 RepID=UPI001746A2ED|nr:glycosyltransferase family 1 protein [Halomonas sp. ML-15]MBD3894307.1 glycosyltransferase family 1 protein [Halomonas sp. ML-15]